MSLKTKIIAAVRSEEDLLRATLSKAEILFMLAPDIAHIKSQAELARRAGKKLFIHLDLAEGIGKDGAGIRFVKEQGVDGIISTRTNLIKLAKKEKMFTIQRFFALDSQSVASIAETAKSSNADVVEIMPGIVTKVIKNLKQVLEVPIVAGGLIETKEEIEEAFSCGADAVSTGKKEFWGCF